MRERHSSRHSTPGRHRSGDALYGRGFGSGGLGIGPPFTPPVVKQLLIANAAVFFAQRLGLIPESMFAAIPSDFWQRGFLWQPFTYMWLHGGLGHIAANMFALWMFGSPLALAWGPQRFLRFYLLCGIGAGLIIVTFPWLLVLLGGASPVGLMIPTLGASGAIFGVLLGYSLTWPDRQILMFPIPIAFRAIWLIPILLFAEVSFGPANVSHLGHLGGLLVGWLLLRGHGDAASALSIDHWKYRWRRYRMRKRLHAVDQDDWRDKNRQGPWLH